MRLAQEEAEFLDREGEEEKNNLFRHMATVFAVSLISQNKEEEESFSLQLLFSLSFAFFAPVLNESQPNG